jgi:hypothetical protein
MFRKKRRVLSSATEHRIEDFAEDLGKLLGHAQNKAEGWLDQRKQVATHLKEIRDTASVLLEQLGDVSGNAAGKANRAYRSTARTQPEKLVADVKKRVRTMSAEAREAISKAQKARWAKWKSLKK